MSEQSLFLCVTLSSDVINKLTYVQGLIKQQYGGNFSYPTSFHITVDCLSDNWGDIAIANKAMQKFSSRNNKKFEVMANKVNFFNGNICWVGVDNYYPLKLLKEQVEEDFKNTGFTLKKEKFPSYIPHITMGFDVIEDKLKKIEFEPISFTVDNITLSNGLKINEEYSNSVLYRADLK
jgi:2'-5' RNA ligase